MQVNTYHSLPVERSQFLESTPGRLHVEHGVLRYLGACLVLYLWVSFAEEKFAWTLFTTPTNSIRMWLKILFVQCLNGLLTGQSYDKECLSLRANFLQKKKKSKHKICKCFLPQEKKHTHKRTLHSTCYWEHLRDSSPRRCLWDSETQNLQVLSPTRKKARAKKNATQYMLLRTPPRFFS